VDEPVVLGQVELVAGRASVALGVFSGRENPTWPLKPAELEALSETLASLSPVDDAAGAPADGLPPYYGFVVETNGSLRPEVRYVEAYDGLVVLRDENRAELARVADPDYRVELLLFESAAAAGLDEAVYNASAGRFSAMTGLEVPSTPLRPDEPAWLGAALEAYEPGQAKAIAQRLAAWLSEGGPGRAGGVAQSMRRYRSSR
jgi:hypothetical protein